MAVKVLESLLSNQFNECRKESSNSEECIIPFDELDLYLSWPKTSRQLDKELAR